MPSHVPIPRQILHRSTPPPHLANQPNPRTRWLMLALVWLAYASFGLTVGSIPPLVEPIIQDLKITYSQMGLVLGAWQLLFIVTATPLGALVDRLGVRRAFGIGIGIIWISLVLRGIAVDFTTLFASVALFGFGGPIISIGAPKVVALWFHGKERSLAAGIYTTAPISGLAIALATAPGWIMQLTNTWRGTSLVYGGVIMVVFFAWWLFAKDIQTSQGLPLESTRYEPLPRAIAGLLHLRNMQIILIVAIFAFFLNHGLTTWTPALLQEGGRTIAQAGSLTSISTILSAACLLLILRLATNGRRRAILWILILFSSSATTVLALSDGPLLVSSLMISSIARVPLMPISTLILMETPGIGERMIGRASGLFFSAAEIGGFGGPLFLGYLRDTTGSLIPGFIAMALISGILLLFVPLIQEKRAGGEFPTSP